MMSDAVATAMREDMVLATVELKLCSLYRRPPTKKQQPRTRRMFERIEPSMLAWTIRISPFRRAMMLTCEVLACDGRCSIVSAYDKLNSISERRIEQTTQGLSQRYSQLFGRESQQRGQRDDGNEVEDEL